MTCSVTLCMPTRAPTSGRKLSGCGLQRRRRDFRQTDVTLIAAGAEATLSDLIGRGRQLAGVGTTLSFERTLKGERYEVRLSFGSRGANSLWQRFHAAIRGY